MLGRKKQRTNKRKSESFLSKLYDILSSANYNKIISWDKEGEKIIIFDVMKLCNEVLPKFYKHRNYSSFIRQLNLYGFRKSKGVNESFEKYEHEKFNKNITKEEIKQISKSVRQNNMIKNIDYFISNTQDEETKDIDNTHIPDDKVLTFLTKKIDENTKYFQNEIDKLKNELIKLNNEIEKDKSIINSNKIVISKLIKNSINKNIENRKHTKINSIKELFKRYLYHFKIYSPFFDIDIGKIIKHKEKEDNKININEKINSPRYNYINNNDLNISRDMDDLSFLNNANNIQFFDLNMHNINYSNSFINNRFCK